MEVGCEFIEHLTEIYEVAMPCEVVSDDNGSVEFGHLRSSGAYRTLNVVIPADAYWHVRRCATESHLALKDYMARFCLEAKPYAPSDGKAVCG